MPWNSLLYPSLGLSMLKGGLADRGISAEIRYFNFPFAERIGVDPYLNIANQSTYDLLGDWVFAAEVFDRLAGDGPAYVEQILRNPGTHYQPFLFPAPEELVETVLGAQGEVEAYLDACLQEVVRRRPRVMGFSCVHHQQVASLALAKRVKQQRPETFIVFGGPNCEGIRGVEMVRQFDFLDGVVSGEGEVAFPALSAAVLNESPLPEIPGVYVRGGRLPHGVDGRCPNAPIVSNLDDLPLPDYHDYFEQLGATRVPVPYDQDVLVETSRGCCWGRCTFCSLPGADRPYRLKSAERALAEIAHVAREYPGHHIQLVDITIDRDRFNDLVPGLAAHNVNAEIGCHTRCDMSKQQLRALRSAGITCITFGIESLSTAMLRIMRKGTTTLQNIQILKWSKELGLDIDWNLLWGFAGEPPEAYTEMAALVPRLAHLQPPLSFGRIHVDRFCACFDGADEIGLAALEPSPAYGHVYPLSRAAQANLALYFTYQYRSPQAVEEYTKPLREALRSWHHVHADSDLFALDDGRRLFVSDQRVDPAGPLTVLTGIERTLYKACDQVRNAQALRQVVEARTGSACTARDVEARLTPLVECGLMIREGGRYLSLAIPVGEYRPRTRAWRRFVAQMERERQLTRLEGIRGRVRFTDNTARARVGPAEVVRALRSRRSKKLTRTP